MRRLLWFSLGYCAAAGLCALWRPGLWSVAAGLVLCGLTVLLFFLEKRERRLALAVLAAAGLGIGLLWCAGYRSLRLTPLEAVDGQEMEISLELCDYAKQTRYGGSVTGYAEVEGTRCKILLYTDEYEADWKPGDRVSLAAELRLTAEGGAREPTYHRTQGIFLLAYPRGEARLEPGEGIPVRYYPALWRRSLTRCVQQCFPEDTAGFVQGFLLGDKSDLSYEARNSLSLAGLSHLIAVSGLHISMLFGALYPLTGKRRFLSLLLGAPVLLGYAAVAGFTPSASRAAIMGILILLATALNREYDPPTALGFSALVLLAANPLAIASVSFQLSFAAVGGIFLFSSCIQRWCEKRLNGDKGPGFTKRLLRLCIATVSITLGAGAATTPLVAYYFGHISLLSPLTNFCVSGS